MAKFTEEQKEAWIKCKASLKIRGNRALRIAMSELRQENGRTHRGPIETLPKNPNKLQQYHAIIRNEQLIEKKNKWKEFLTNPGAKKLFIIVDPQLSPAQKAVQASHCAAQFQKEHPLAPWVNGTMILLEPIQDEWYKRYGFERLVLLSSSWKTVWREPDMGNAVTAIACLPEFRDDEFTNPRCFKLI